MLTVPVNSPLAKPALDVVLAMFNALLIKPLDQRHVDFHIDAVNSRLIMTAREVATNGDYGIYYNAMEMPYLKASLLKVLPYPIVYQGPWPTSFRALRLNLQARYGILLEEGEFALLPNSAPLVDGSPLSGEPNPDSGVVALTALPASGRWLSGTTLRLIVAASNGPTRLKALVDVDRPADLSTLTYAGPPLDLP